MDKVIKNKRDLGLVTSRSSGYETSSYNIGYILSDQVWWCNVKLFSSFTNLDKPIHEIINYSTFICPFKSGLKRIGKEWKKLQKIEYLHNEKSFLDDIKHIFHGF